jgi:hypothetical protein
MPRFFVSLPMLALLLVALPARAQLPFDLGIEARAGIALPTGEFGAQGGDPHFDAGPQAGIGLLLGITPRLFLLGAVHRTWFGCPQCEALGLDRSVIRDGGEVGLHLVTPFVAGGATPWIRGSVQAQTLAFTGFGEHRTSSTGFGLGAAAGVAFPLAARLELHPGLSFQRTPVDFRFGAFPDRSVVITAASLDVGLLYRF